MRPPPLIRDSDDVSSWDIELPRAKLAICPDTDGVESILKAEEFLSAAIMRLSEIESSQGDPPMLAVPRRLDS